MPDDTTAAAGTTGTTEAASTAASATSGTAAAGTPAGSTADASGAASTIADATASSAAGAAAAPVPYTLKVPDGATADAGLVERTTATARELGLSNEAAQKLLDREVARTAEITTATTAAVDAAKAEQLAAMQPGGTIWKEQESGWRAKALADAEIGGSPEKLEASVGLAMKVMNKFASDDTKKFLTDTGLGSHPEFVRILARIGKQMSEASLVTGSAGASGTLTQEERLAKLYPTMAKSA